MTVVEEESDPCLNAMFTLRLLTLARVALVLLQARNAVRLKKEYEQTNNFPLSQMVVGVWILY